MKALKILLVVLLSTFVNRSLASHAAGGYFRYTCLGNNDYQVDYYFLRDCSGNDVPNAVVFWLTNSCQTPNCWPLDGYLAQRVSLETANYGCGANCDENDNNPPTFQWAKFSRIITLPYACADWTISVSIQARNTVAFCEASNSPNYYNYCKINNTNGLCNSSLAYTGYPLALGCTGDMGTSVYGWTNPDGSTIQAEFVYPQAGECNAHYDMTYVGGATLVRPYPAVADFNFSPTSGQFDFQPLNQMGNSYFAVKYTEYDINGTYLGETVVDGMIYISNECEQTSPITFSDWFFDDDNTLYVNGTGELCGELHLTPNDPDEHVTSISVSGLPDYMSYSYEYNSDGTANVTVCGEWPVEYLCQQVDVPFVVEAVSSGDDCLSQVTGSGWEGYYHMIKERGDYCPENLYFTNRNSTSGNIMPLTARAEDRIWIGDDMPAPYDPFDDGPEGPVTVPDGGHYTAGIEVVLPSCDGGGNGCVTILGNCTIEILPGSCSAECYREPLDVYVKEVFKCSHEKLEVIASGEGPFTYELIILGDTITSNLADFHIHDIISEQDNGQVPYTINVYDAIGDSGTFSGFILGTKRFYEPILDNKFYSVYADNNPAGPTGWYYGANLGVYSDTPAYFTDSVNTTPPWYGATDMWLIVWDRWGHPAVNIRHDLQLQPDGSGGEDWSLNQGEFYWTGKQNNGIWADCYENNETMFFNYTLKARNCYDDQNMEMFVQGMDEASTVCLFSCTDDDPWHPVETKSSHIGDDNNDYAESQVLTGISRVPEIRPEHYTDIFLTPNPAKDDFTIVSEYSELYNVILSDQSGKVVLALDVLKQGEKIDVSSLTNGIYTVSVKTPDAVKQFKLVVL